MDGSAQRGKPAGVRARLAMAALLVTSAVALLAASPGPPAVLVVASLTHGLDLRDLPAVALLMLATSCAAGTRVRLLGDRRARPRPSIADVRMRLALAGSALVFAAAARSEMGDVPSNSALDLVLLVLVVAATAPLGMAWPSGVVVPLACLVGGWPVDAAVLPTGTLLGPAALAVGVALGAGHRRLALGELVLASALLLASALSLADVAGIDVLMARGGGGPARTGALGVVLLSTAALASRRPQHGRPVDVRRNGPGAGVAGAGG